MKLFYHNIKQVNRNYSKKTLQRIGNTIHYFQWK